MKKIAYLTLLSICSCYSVTAQTLDRKFYQPDNTVYEVLPAGDNIYIGGKFRKLGLPAFRLARINENDSLPDINFPQLDRNSFITASEPDGTGGFYIAGILRSLNGVPLPDETIMLHILQEGAIDAAFANPVKDAGMIKIIKKRNNRIYIGGDFTKINSQERKGLAALDATTGALLDWQPNQPVYPPPSDIIPSDSLVFLMGIQTVGNTDVRRTISYEYFNSYYMYSECVAFTTDCGSYVPNVLPAFNKPFTKMLIEDSSIYLGGPFFETGVSANSLAKMKQDDYSPINEKFAEVRGLIKAIVKDGKGGWYIGGNFTHVNDTLRNGLAHIMNDGSLDTSFNANLAIGSEYNNPPVVTTLATDGEKLYVGGYGLRTCPSCSEVAMMVFSIGTGKQINWKKCSGYVYAITISNKKVYIGGKFSFVDHNERHNVAAFDTSGNTLIWNPDVDDAVFSITPSLSGEHVYIGGAFNRVNDSSRNALAKVTTDGEGRVTSFNANLDPNALPTVFSIVEDGAYVYIAGDFSQIGSYYIYGFAQLDTLTAKATTLKMDFHPYGPSTLAIDGDYLYMGGEFKEIQNKHVPYLARMHRETLVIDNWNLHLNGEVNAIDFSGAFFVIGGKFNLTDCINRTMVAAIDAKTYELRDWKLPTELGTETYVEINDILHKGSEIIIGGRFTFKNYKTTEWIYDDLVSIDDVTGIPTEPYVPSPSNGVHKLAISGDKLFLAGEDIDLYFEDGVKRFLISYDLKTHKLNTTSYNPGKWNNSTDNIFSDKNNNLIAVSNNNIWNTVDRDGLAALNINTGKPIDWFTNNFEEIYSLAIKDSLLFAGGEYSLRSYHLSNGEMVKRFTISSGSVYDLCIQDTTLYAVGNLIISSGTNKRNNAVAYSILGNGTSKDVLPWNPYANATVNTIQALPLKKGGDLFLGGSFTEIQQHAAVYLVRVDNKTGLKRAFDPQPDAPVSTLLLNGKTLYVGGKGFSSIGGKKRNSLAAFNAINNKLLSFNPNLKYYNKNPNVLALAAENIGLFIGTDSLNLIGNSNSGTLALVNTKNSTTLPFNPKPNNAVHSIALSKNKLFAGGDWNVINKTIFSPAFFAAFTLPPSRQASSIQFSNITPTSVTTAWTNGNGEGRLAVIKEAGLPDAPADGKAYTASNSFGSGQTTGIKSFVVATGSNNSIYITKLLPNRNYTVSVFEYNGSDNATDYLQEVSLSGQFTTPRVVTVGGTSDAAIIETGAKSESDKTVSILPNPVQSIATVLVKKNEGKINVTLTDMQGRTLAMFTASAHNQFTMDMSKYASGTYLVTVKDDTETRTLKLVKE